MGFIGISGSNGFVGGNLTKYLVDDFSIKKYSRSDLGGTTFLFLDDCSAFVHLAGKAHDLKGFADERTYEEVNFLLTKKIYDAFLVSKAKKFIFISSVKACADSIDGILTEEVMANPQNVYGKSKLMAEQYIESRELPAGKNYYILRPCMIHGPGNKGNLNLLYKLVKKGIPYPLAAFENKRSFLSVENLCFVIKSILDKPLARGIYNVADDEALSTNDVIGVLAASLNKRVALWKVHPVLIGLFARLGDFFKFSLNTHSLNKLTENYIVSNNKIKLSLGVELPISAREGLKITALSFNS